MTSILVTGFEPWGKIKANPSALLAEEFGGVVLPTRYRDSERVLLEAVRERRPGALLMLGLADKRKAISIEMLAVNADHAKERDNAGERRIARPIDRRGPPALWTGLSAGKLFDALKKARIPVQLSYHAGTFCCNHLFYVALRKLRIPCGFVHVPALRTMPLAMQKRGVRILMEALS